MRNPRLKLEHQTSLDPHVMPRYEGNGLRRRILGSPYCPCGPTPFGCRLSALFSARTSAFVSKEPYRAPALHSPNRGIPGRPSAVSRRIMVRVAIGSALPEILFPGMERPASLRSCITALFAIRRREHGRSRPAAILARRGLGCWGVKREPPSRPSRQQPTATRGQSVGICGAVVVVRTKPQPKRTRVALCI